MLLCQHSTLVDLLLKLHLSSLDFLGRKLQTASLVAIGWVQIFSHFDQLLDANASLFVDFLGQLFQTLSPISSDSWTILRALDTMSAKTTGSIPTLICWDLISWEWYSMVFWTEEYGPFAGFSVGNSPWATERRLRSRTRCTRCGNNRNTLVMFRWFWQALGNLGNVVFPWALNKALFGSIRWRLASWTLWHRITNHSFNRSHTQIQTRWITTGTHLIGHWYQKHNPTVQESILLTVALETQPISKKLKTWIGLCK